MQAIRQSVVIAQIRNKWYQELHRRKVVTKRLRKAERARKKDGPAPPEELDHLTAVLRTLGEDGPQLDQQWLMVRSPDAKAMGSAKCPRASCCLKLPVLGHCLAMRQEGLRRIGCTLGQQSSEHSLDVCMQTLGTL